MEGEYKLLVVVVNDNQVVRTWKVEAEAKLLESRPSALSCQFDGNSKTLASWLIRKERMSGSATII